MWQALQQAPWIHTLANTGWMYDSVAVSHYLGMFWFIGSIAIVDLRVMGLTARKKPLEDVAKQLFPWFWTGFALAVISGFLMFATDASDWAPSYHFHIKLVLIGIAVLFAIVVQASARKWSAATKISSAAKVIALVSLLLWIATIISASEIPALEGLGTILNFWK
jgi:Family of unknown function (DUF6644)